MGIAEMLTQQETLSIQVMSKYMYNIGVPRILAKFKFSRMDHYIPAYKLGETLIMHYNAKTESINWISHPLVQLE